jgi:hypothetical protein
MPAPLIKPEVVNGQAANAGHQNAPRGSKKASFMMALPLKLADLPLDKPSEFAEMALGGGCSTERFGIHDVSQRKGCQES